MAVADAASPLNAYAIFLHARSAVTSARYPRRIDYTIAVGGIDGDVPKIDHYRASSDLASGEIHVASISEEDLASPPPIPRGVSFNLTATLCSGKGGGCGTYADPAGRSAQAPDLIGTPILAPTYMFGLRYGQPTEATAHTSSEADALPVIAVVSTKKRDYSVALAGIPTIDGAPTYHLLLTPLRNPKKNRLRELWVGTADYLPRQAVVAGNFTLAPLVDVPWTLSFSVIDGAPVLTRESANATLYLPHHRVLHDARIAFDGIHDAGTTIVGEPLLQPPPTATALVEPGEVSTR